MRRLLGRARAQREVGHELSGRESARPADRARRASRRRARPRGRDPARRRSRRRGPPAVRRLRARPVLRDPLRLLRLQHLHRRGAGRRRLAGGLPGPGGRRDPARPPRARRRATPRSAPCSSAAARRPLLPPEQLGEMLQVIDGQFGLAPGAEVTVEANPETVNARVPGAPAGERRDPGFVRDAISPSRTCWTSLTAARARAARSVRRLGPRRGVRAREPGSHLRHAGGERRGLAPVAGGGAGARARTTSPPTRSSSRRAPGSRRGSRRGELAGPGRRRDGRPLPARRGRAQRARARLVRGVQLGRVRRRPVPAQPALLDRRRLVGGRPRRAQPRRRHPVVEREAPVGLRRRGWRRRQSRPRARDPDPRRTAAGTGHAPTPAGRRPARSASWSPPARDAAAKAVRTASRTHPPWPPARVVLTLRGRLLADAVIRDLTPLGPTASRSLPAQRTGPCAR